MNFSKLLCSSLLLICTSTSSIWAQKPDSTKQKLADFTLFKGRSPYRTWSVGGNLGGLAPVAFTRGNNDFSDWDVNLGYDVFVRKQLAHSFGLELNMAGGKVSGSNTSQPNGVANGLINFETSFWSASLQGVVNVATIDFLRKENWINFLLKAGWGTSAFSYKQMDGFGVETNYKGTYGASGTKTYLYQQLIPVGVGAKFKISNRLNFNLGYTINFVGNDNFDGTVVSKTSTDRFSYAYSGVEFSLGKPAKKPNLDWVNPAAMLYDDLYNRLDTTELAALKKRVSKTEKEIDYLKCDSDGDGVADIFDKCPDTPAGVLVSGNGCPLDIDQDGVADYVDKCPLQKGTKETNGCPVVEKVAIPVKAPVQLSAEEQKILQDVFDNLEFNTGKWTIKPGSFESLNKLATLLITKRNYSLKISGHTDDVGSEKTNQILSANRANAVKTYLVKKGVLKNRIEARGYGESQPIADNSTEEGRQRNRRVEFNVF
ncbi:MAG: OmpA family protein [Sphingobacteriaceae bacterium]